MQTAGVILLMAAGVIVLFGGGQGHMQPIPTVVLPHDGALVSGVIH